jgi:hypothetical protein
MIWLSMVCIPILEKSYMITILLLLLSYNKRLRLKKAEAESLKIISDQFAIMFIFYYDYDSPSNVSNDVYVAKFVWPSLAKSFSHDTTL